MNTEVVEFIRTTYKDKSAAKKLLLMVIASRCSVFGYCAPSIAELAEDCCVTERYVQKMLTQLVESGDLHIEYNAGEKTSNGYTNVYTLAKYRQRYNQLAVQS